MSEGGKSSKGGAVEKDVGNQQATGEQLANMVHEWYPFISREGVRKFYRESMAWRCTAVANAALCLWVHRRTLAHEAKMVLEEREGFRRGEPATERCRYCGLEWSCPECDGKGTPEE
jgi:hypothetical protein